MIKFEVQPQAVVYSLAAQSLMSVKKLWKDVHPSATSLYSYNSWLENDLPTKLTVRKGFHAVKPAAELKTIHNLLFGTRLSSGLCLVYQI